jgi:undecaprenyl diphosphate synthase
MELEEKKKKVKERPLPRHVAIIMDGNARWAERHKVSKSEAYLQGIKRAWEVVLLGEELGIEFLTLYAFSKENWRRPPEEVESLMRLCEDFLRKWKDQILDHSLRVKVLGDMDDLPPTVRTLLLETIELTDSRKGTTVNLALSYSGRWEILQAVRKIAHRVKEGSLLPDEIEEDLFSKFLLTGEIPDPDLLIRTSGEKRVSNFLLWQLAYTELYFTEVLWPDFTQERFLEAILDYQHRERRFGMTRDQVRKERL